MRPAELFLPLQQRALAWVERRAPPSTLPPHLQTGLRGEQEAHFYLRRLGFTVVAHRFTASPTRGDLDLVAWDGETLVFVEIKTRTARDFAAPASSIDRSKKTQLRRLAHAYLRQFPRPRREQIAVRFDVVSVYLLPSEPAAFEHVRSAFALREAPQPSRRSWHR